MEFLNNFSKLTNLNKKEDCGYFNILLTRNAVEVCFWKKGKDNEVEIATMSNLRHFDSFEDCLLKTDQCFQELGPDSEKASKAVFSLDSTFLQRSDIKKDYKSLIKKLCSSLSLKAIGFIDDKEALIQKAIDEKGDHTNSLLIEYVGRKMYCYFVSRGRLLFDFLVESEDELFKKIKSNIDENHQINKIVLFSAYLQKNLLLEKRQKILKKLDLEEIQTDHLVFSFFSQAELLTILTIEGGKAFFENNIVCNVKNKKPKQDLNQGNFNVSQENLNIDDDKDDYQDEDKEEVEVDGDVSEVEKNEIIADEIEEEKKDLKLDNEDDKNKENLQSQNSEKIDDNFDKYLVEDTLIKKSPKKSRRRLKKINFSSFFGWWQWLIIFSLVALGGIYFLISYLNKVIITLTPQDKFLSTEKKITINVDAENPDWENLILPGKVAEEEINKSGKIETTGTSQVGEKAQGEIVIINKDKNNSKNFDKGTKITCNNIQFTLDKNTLASAASVEKNDDGEKISYSKVESTMTAVEIGSDGNISNDIKCTISNYETNKYEVVTTSNFSGGASQEVKVVTKEDRNQLLTNVQEEILQQAADFFKAKSQNGEFYEFSGNFEIIESNFDHEIGNQTEELNLDLTLKVKAIVYNGKDLKELAVNVLQKDLPEGYQLVEGDPGFTSYVIKDSTESANLKENEEEQEMTNLIYLKANISQNAQANLDFEIIKSQITGLSLLKAEEIIKTNKDVKFYQIEFKPLLAKFLGKIPKNKEKISIELKSDE